MAHGIALPRAQAPSIPIAADRSARVPWYVWCCVLATTFATIGGVWDISWHESIGRDSFWTPAHLLIYLCGVLAGLGCGYLILSTTFDPASPLRGPSVRLWGFRGPLGAFIAAWGGIAMIVSAPFDNWWHNAYGLDVKVLSPPHVVLILGLLSIRFGTLILILAAMNRATGPLRRRLDWLFLYIGALFLGGMIGAFMEQNLRVFMHGARFYLIAAIVVPLVLAAVARASSGRWAATLATAILSLVTCLFVWILPLVPAAPKLGPVYQNITHLVPPDFAKLFLFGALAFDLVRRLASRKSWSDWKLASLGGLAFLAAYIAVQWPFADFLMSPASRNWFFATQNFPYMVPSSSEWVRNIFVPTESSPAQFATRMAFAFLAAILSARAGLAWGAWMRRVQR